MHNRFLFYLFFLFFTLAVNGMEFADTKDFADTEDGERQRLLTAGGNATSGRGSTASSSERSSYEASEGEGSERRRPLNLINDDEDFGGGVTPLFTNQETSLFPSLERNVFRMDDPITAKGSRWTGRLFGTAAVNAIIPMILYVVLTLFSAPTDSGALEWTITALSLAYLLMPSIENMGQMGQVGHDAARNCCDPQSQIPEEFKGVSPSSSIPLTIASNVHAGTMALILTTIFHHIETSKAAPYSWFFWTFFSFYAAAIYYKNISFFNHGKRIEKAHHPFEDAAEKRTRRVIEQAFSKFENQDLRKLDRNELEDLYSSLTNPHNTTVDKLKEIKGTRALQFEVSDPSLSSRLDRQTYSRPWTIQYTLAKEATNIVFYGSMIPEYVFYQFGLGLACQNFGGSPLTASIISHIGAVILSGISFSFEKMSIRKYYATLLEQKFGSSLSISNPILRKGIGIKSFLISSFIALSEVYPSWKATLSGNYASYPLLTLMVLRHHARNAFWLQGGYDRVISNYHLRDCWRNNSCCCFESCRTGKNREEMINFISLIMRRLSAFSDQLNADGSKVLYKGYFGYEPEHY